MKLSKVFEKQVSPIVVDDVYLQCRYDWCVKKGYDNNTTVSYIHRHMEYGGKTMFLFYNPQKNEILCSFSTLSSIDDDLKSWRHIGKMRYSELPSLVKT